jgi:hypothetical protein
MSTGWQTFRNWLYREPKWHSHTSAFASNDAPEGHGSGSHALACGLQNWPSSHGAELAVGIVMAPIGINAIAATGARRRTDFLMCQPPLKGTSGRVESGTVNCIDGSK